MTTEELDEEMSSRAKKDRSPEDIEGEQWEEESATLDDEDADAGVVPDSTQGEGESSDAEPLDELEAEELEMLTEDESSETLVVDEAAELRAIRRAEIALAEESASEAADDEFVCTNCFLVLKTSQRAPGRRMICKDCAG